jgi:glycerol-3-phosphate acyltransferase PlsY
VILFLSVRVSVMQDWMIILLAYLMGAIPFSYIITHIIESLDIRRLGNGNAGGKNTLESVGILPGLLVVFLDISKGALAVMLAQRFSDAELVIYLAGAAAVLGHDFPIYLGFRGGQGMAALTGTFLVFMPHLVAISALACFITLWITKKWDTSCAVGFVLLAIIMLMTRQSLGLRLYSQIILPMLGVMKLLQKRQARTEHV